MKIIKTTKIYDNRIYLPKEILELLKAKNGDTLIFGLNYEKEVVIFVNKDEKKSARFNIISTTG
jgi:bifunctional DNA-binding transcriptional regulator/antitoxin component of YhaV-PrlF toxin-antitoxin module